VFSWASTAPISIETQAATVITGNLLDSEVDTIYGLLHRVDMDDFSDVSEVHTVSIFKGEVCSLVRILFSTYYGGSRDIAVGIATGYGLEGQGVGV
jgi:hypothetical protein